MTVLRDLVRQGVLQEQDLMEIDEDGWCQSMSVFCKIAPVFPAAPIAFTIRTFTLDAVISISLSIDGLGMHNCVNINQPVPADVFPVLLPWVEQHRLGRTITMSRFIESGEELATLLGRELTIYHQNESGDPLQGGLRQHGPYRPKQSGITPGQGGLAYWETH